MKAASFKIKSIEQEIANNGFVIIPSFLNKAEVNSLLELYNSMEITKSPGQCQWNSIWHAGDEVRDMVSSAITSVVRPKLDNYFDDCVCPIATFMSKLPEKNGVMPAHRDFSILDEEQFQYRNCWIPLVNIEEDNGILFVFRKSHKIFPYILPMQNPWPYHEFVGTMMKQAEYVKVNAGDMVVYGDKTIHGSLANVTDKDRPVLHFGALHKDYEMVYYYLDPHSSERIVEIYSVPKEYYLTRDLSKKPVGFPLVRKIKYDPPRYSNSEFEQLCEELV